METPNRRKGYQKSTIYFFSVNYPMITSTLAQLHWYKTISPNFEKAIDYALATDFSNLETGKYSIDGENVMAIINEYTTKPDRKSTRLNSSHI